MEAIDQGQMFNVRLIIERPLAGVSCALQRRGGTLDAGTVVDGDSLQFDATVRIGKPTHAGPINLLGEFVSGPATERFIYITSGQRAGQHHSRWDRRAKVKLATLPAAMIEAASRNPAAIIEARIEGSGRDCGACCASVVLLVGGWRLIAQPMNSLQHASTLRT